VEANMHWKKAVDFAEIAEALKVETVDIMAAMISPDGSILAMFTPVPADDDPEIYSSKLERDADDILVAGPPLLVEKTSAFVERMNVDIGKALEEKLGPPMYSKKVEPEFQPGPTFAVPGEPGWVEPGEYRGTIPPYDVPPDDEDPEEPDDGA
jgi:hypothetical protein